jgi:DNA-directed RNA polymerase specialized sigma24 family protein
VLRRIALDVVKSRSHQTRRDAVRDAAHRDDERAAVLDALPSQANNAEQIARAVDAQQIMIHVRDLLSPRDLTWLELVLIETTHQEIADSYRVPKATVDKAMQRAWEKIKVAFGREVPL